MSSTKTITVGSVVRAPRTQTSFSKLYTGRAVVAIMSDDGTASILWEDPEPRHPAGIGGRKRRLDRPFLVTPDFRNVTTECFDEEEDEEEEVPLSSLSSILPFEFPTCDDGRNSGGESSNDDVGPDVYKERGDELFRLGDPSAAATQYESALARTSCVDVGGTIVVNVGGRPVLAEIDCIDDNDESIDVTFLDGDKEGTVKEKSILLGIMEGDSKGRLQERILLNLSRCLLQLSEIDARKVDRPNRYRKAAVLGCTLAITCSSYHAAVLKNPSCLSSPSGVTAVTPSRQQGTTEEKARFLRATAYANLGKTKHATADLRYVLKVNPGHKQAQKLAKELERGEALKRRSDKKLAKEMCRWVEHATAVAPDQDNEEAHLVSDDDGDIAQDVAATSRLERERTNKVDVMRSADQSATNQTKPPFSQSSDDSLLSDANGGMPTWLPSLIIVIASMTIYQIFSSY